jgi:predicted nucleotidyltransferase component of viral defense system
MIFQKEIIEIAHAKRVQTKTIEKDWILGHFLNAMYSFEEVRKNFVFKGGTCLRKCYFENYRFSEDLDFTLLDRKFEVNMDFINKIIKKAESTSGAKFYFERKKLQKANEVEKGFEIKIKYWGADHKQNQNPLPPLRWQTYIKLDISFAEKLLTKPVLKPIIHNYSDKEMIFQSISVYSLEEVISEKLRSLIQRNRPRDVYDIWTLSGLFVQNDYPLIRRLLDEKAKPKNVKFNSVNDFINQEKGRKNSRAWVSSLGNHLPENQLPDFDTVYNDVYQFIEKILNT